MFMGQPDYGDGAHAHDGLTTLMLRVIPKPMRACIQNTKQ